MKNKNFNWKIFVVCILIVYLAAFIGSIFTSQNTSSAWYASVKPAITPPNFVFPIVWNVLFLLIGLSLYFAWVSDGAKLKKKSEIRARSSIAIAFGINLFLNALWSFLFFYLKLPAVAFIELAVLWLSILSMIFITFRIRKLSSFLLIPYAAWVAFAGVLNGIIAFS